VIVSNLRRQRMTVEEIEAEARLSEIASRANVRWAIIETNGRISFVERAGDRD
jgi:uncharacterized membrane protein YcaP (DUF421 family)